MELVNYVLNNVESGSQVDTVTLTSLKLRRILQNISVNENLCSDFFRIACITGLPTFVIFCHFNEFVKISAYKNYENYEFCRCFPTRLPTYTNVNHLNRWIATKNRIIKK